MLMFSFSESMYIGRRLVTNTQVPANIHKPQFRNFWDSELKQFSSELLQSTISLGYKLPFKSIPPESHEGNNKSARLDMEFVKAEVYRLEALGCVSRVYSKPHLVLPLSSIFSKKKRVVIDASRALNPYLQDRNVRLQDLRDLPSVLTPGSFQSSDDLDSGYWHLKIYPDHRKYLGSPRQEKAFILSGMSYS